MQPYLADELVRLEQTTPTPYNYTELGYRGYLKDIKSGVGKNLVRYYNSDDFWLATGHTSFGLSVDWVSNQKGYKPNALISSLQRYWFYPAQPPGLQVVLEDVVHPNTYTKERTVTDPYESMAYAARSRTKAVGAEVGDGAFPITEATSLDLKATYDFTDHRPDHSGQFQRNGQRGQSTILDRFQSCR